MKTTTKFLLAGAAIAASGVANAQISVLPTASTGSDVVLFVTDTLTGATFVQDLGVTLDSLGVTTASVAADAVAENEYSAGGLGNLGTISNPVGTNGTDSSLASFLQANGTANMVYGLLASFAGIGEGPGQQRLLTTFTTNPSTIPPSSASTGVAGFWNEPASSAQVNNAQQTNTAFFLASNSGTAKYDYSSNGLFAASPYGLLSAAALGSTVYLYELSSYSDGNEDTDANWYASSTAFTVSTAGVISGFASGGGGAPVPLPAAVWLFGSGLIGLFGIGRRRVTA